MPYLILGFCLLGALLLAARWLAVADVTKLAPFLGWLAVGAGIAGGGALLALFIASDRLAMALVLAAGLVLLAIWCYRRWRDHQANAMLVPAHSTGSDESMTRDQAFAILGLVPGANSGQIKDAHRRLMRKNHPDRGGSPFLVGQINRAKEMLLGE